MKSLLTSDWHEDWVTEGVARYDDISVAVDETVQAALDEEVDFYMMLGDLSDPDRNPTVFRAIAKAMQVALDLSNHGIESHWLVGNHDVNEDGSGSSVLTPMGVLSGVPHGGRIHLHDRPGLHPIGNKGARLLALPYTPLSHTYDPLPYCTKELKTDYPLIVISHLGITGIQPGEETKDLPRGRDVILPHRVFESRKAPTYIFSGHYHHGQQFENVQVVGSLAKLFFSPDDYKPSYLLADIPDA